MAALTNSIPEKTIERLSEYRRTLLASHKQGITHIFSHVLAGIHGITAVQVRRDLMLIGFSSDTKKGYDVQVLIEYISKILDSPSQMNIAVLGMGVAGAGVATVISQGVSVVLCILYVFRSARLLLPEKKHFHVESRLYWELFSQSISMGLMSSIVSAGSVVLQYGINGLGTLVIAGHTAARKLFSFTDMPLTAMASACSTFVSQNYGANHPDRVRRGMRDIYLYGVVVAVTAILLMSVGAEWMVKLVSGSSEPVVLENGARYLIWNAPFYAVLGVLLVRIIEASPSVKKVFEA